MFVLWLSAADAKCQATFERLGPAPEDVCAFIFGYYGNLKIDGAGSASLFKAPLAGGDFVACLVTAKHMLSNPKTHVPYDGIIAKINMPTNSHPRYVKISIKSGAASNYWVSPSGLDLAVIPLPWNAVAGTKGKTYGEDQIVTPDSAISRNLTAGLVTEMFSVQYEYLEPIDYAIPQTLPTVRLGHLSRLGYIRLPNGTTFIRQHLIDIHSSPGNSGANVMLLVPEGALGSAPMFLGVVQGYNEEAVELVPYDAQITNLQNAINNLTIPTGGTNQTTMLARSLRPPANPNVTAVTPVHELIGLKDNKEFVAALGTMRENPQLYQIFDTVPPISLNR
jgi:hypothetical protein